MTKIMRLTLIACLLTVNFLVMPVHSYNSLVYFQKKEAEHIFKKHTEAVMLLLGDLGEDSKVFEIVSDLPDVYPSLLFTYSKKGSLPYEKLIEMVGVEKMSPPFIIYFAGGKKYLYDSDKFGNIENSKNIATFIESGKTGSLPLLLKSGESLEILSKEERAENARHHTYFDSYSLEEARRDTEKDLFVMAYAFWCTHSDEFAPIFLDLAKIFKVNPNMQFGKIQMSLNEIVGFEVFGYPLVLHWGKDKSGPPSVFQGNRTMDEVLKWIQEKTNNPWVDIEEQRKYVQIARKIEEQQKSVQLENEKILNAKKAEDYSKEEQDQPVDKQENNAEENDHYDEEGEYEQEQL